MTAERLKGIKILEKASHIRLSKEQLKIVEKPFKVPTLINACAGSGKTTMLLFKVMLDILLGIFFPNQITCLTFSRRACKSMIDRYNQILSRLQKMGYAKNFLGTPMFRTFDSWFLALLRRVEPVHIIAGPQAWSAELENSIVKESAVEDKSTQLSNIFACYDYLINNSLTTDGLYTKNHQREFSHFVKTQLSEYRRGDPNFVENYKAVVAEYNRLKSEYQKTDFNDIKVKLLDALNDPQKRPKILFESYLTSELFIDEFQDTNNVQWKIINSLLSESAKQHISVIGDDDQAIYAFRGSNPGLILNFKKIFPNAQIFNLSTNYRTGGNILNAVKASITKNHWRLPKRLLSNTPGKGYVLKFMPKSSGSLFGNTESDEAPKKAMFQALKRELKNPKFKDQSIAILVRTNTYKALTSDELAMIGYFVSPSKSGDILQNKPIYRSCFHLLAAFTFNNFWDFYDESQKMGFRSYRHHIWTIMNEYHLRPTKHFHLSTYFSLAKLHDRYLAKDIKRNPNYNQDRHERQEIQLDRKSQYILNYIQGSLSKNKDSSSLLQKLGTAVLNLTSVYYHYMFKRHFISVNLTKQSLNYFKSLIADYSSITDFFNGEQFKRKQLDSNLKDHNKAAGSGRIQVMTIHQAKGLQFDWVYLVGLSTNEVQPANVEFNHYFAPNISPAKFVEKLLIMSPQSLKYLDHQLTKKQKRQIGSTGYQIRRDLIDLSYYYCQRHHLSKNNLTIQEINQHLADQTLAYSPDVIAKLQKSLRILYNLVRDKSYSVEQERHLLYVGGTRAKKGLCFDTDTDNSPLMDELDTRFITNIYR